MKNNLVIVYLLLLPILTLAQNNLVINPSFEEHTDLPTHFSNGGKSFCSRWYVPSYGSPDYFHTDCSPLYLSMALKTMNFRNSHSGLACIGIIPLSWDGYMEHITGELLNPLQKGRVYRVSFWIKYAGDVRQFSTDCIGVLFTNERFLMYPFDPFYESIYNKKINADIESKEGLFYTNDSTWLEVNFLYKATGGEKYITIGKFYKEKIKLEEIKHYRKADVQLTGKKDKFIRKKKHQNVLLLNENYAEGKYGTITQAYYFIDDVSVSLVDTAR